MQSNFEGSGENLPSPHCCFHLPLQSKLHTPCCPFAMEAFGLETWRYLSCPLTRRGICPKNGTRGSVHSRHSQQAHASTNGDLSPEVHSDHLVRRVARLGTTSQWWCQPAPMSQLISLPPPGLRVLFSSSLLCMEHQRGCALCCAHQWPSGPHLPK